MMADELKEFRNENATIDSLIKRSADITISKGFNTRDYIKQLLLVANEVWESLDYVMWDPEYVDPVLQDILKGFCENQLYLKKMRKQKEMTEHSEIRNKAEFVEELADVVIRVFSLCGANNWDLKSAIIQKLDKNEKREFLHGNKF
jgi:hypothetical protein